MTKQPTNLDNKAVFEQLWGLTNELRQKIEARFELHPDPSGENLLEYSSLDGNMKGSLTATLSASRTKFILNSDS